MQDFHKNYGEGKTTNSLVWLYFTTMLVEKKFPPCLVFLKVHFIGLKTINMLKVNCHMFVVTKKMVRFGPQCFCYSRKESPWMNMKVWKAWYSSVKYKIIYKSTSVNISACPWLRSRTDHTQHCACNLSN